MKHSELVQAAINLLVALKGYTIPAPAEKAARALEQAIKNETL